MLVVGFVVAVDDVFVLVGGDRLDVGMEASADVGVDLVPGVLDEEWRCRRRPVCLP